MGGEANWKERRKNGEEGEEEMRGKEGGGSGTKGLRGRKGDGEESGMEREGKEG